MSRHWTEQEAPAPLDLRLALPALAVWVGCLVGLWATPAAWWVCAAAGGIPLGIGVLRLMRRAARRAPTAGTAPTAPPPAPLLSAVARGAATVAICLAAGTALAALRLSAATNDPLAAAAAQHDWVTVEMTLAGEPTAVHGRFAAVGTRPSPTRWRLAGTATQVGHDGSVVSSGVAVTVFAEGPAWRALRRAQTVRVRGVASPDTFGAVPGVVIRARGDPDVTGGTAWWMRWASTARDGLRHSANGLDADRAGLLRGLTVGDKSGIGTRLSADSKITGLTHLVAVSGTHMAIATGAVVLLLRRFGPRVTALGAATTLAAMVVLVGPQPSVLRAVVMGLIAVLAAVLGRARTALPGLAAAVFGLLLVDPTLAARPGFALSVQATAALVLLAPAWVRALRRRGVPAGWATLVVLPVAAHISTMPVVAAISGRVSLVAIPANIAVSPIVAPTLLLGLLCLVVGPWWPAGGALLARCDSPLLGWITGTAHTLARWPAATVPWPATPTGVLALAGLIVAGLMVLRHRRLRAVVAAGTAGVVLVVAAARVVTVGWPVDGWLLTACEVGQGDGMVLSTGTPGTAVVVDTGPDPEAMDSCLRRLGVERVPLVVLTHFHADHVDGLPGVLSGREVGAIGIGPGREPAAGWDAVRSEAAAAGVPLVSLRVDTRWRAGDLRLHILAPRHTYHGTDSDPNNDSVVLMAAHRGVRMLMTGDIERPAQRALLASGFDLHADVLKQPHHGSSKLLPALVAAVGATVAVIGVGAGNDYGHPAASALHIDRAAGVTTILRTDTDGDVQVCTAHGRLCTARRGPTLEDRGAPVASAR